MPCGDCSACGRENPPDARFYNRCGTALPHASAPRVRRKTVTMLLCDVTGSTALGERLDPESLQQVVVAGTDERLAAGDAVNLAARLGQVAALGEIIIGPQTWRLVRDMVSAERLGRYS